MSDSHLSPCASRLRHSCIRACGMYEPRTCIPGSLGTETQVPWLQGGRQPGGRRGRAGAAQVDVCVRQGLWPRRGAGRRLRRARARAALVSRWLQRLHLRVWPGALFSRSILLTRKLILLKGQSGWGACATRWRKVAMRATPVLPLHVVKAVHREGLQLYDYAIHTIPAEV
jgi:hypothetical protein